TLLPIRKSLRKRNPSTTGRNRRKSRVLDKTRTGHVPHIGKQQHISFPVKLAEDFCFLFLLGIRHTGVLDAATGFHSSSFLKSHADDDPPHQPGPSNAVVPTSRFPANC